MNTIIRTDVDEIMPATGIAIFEAEIDKQISTAKNYPRNLERVRETALALATATPELAADCMYALKRESTVIEGPSVRLAELMVYAYGNVRAASRIIDEQDGFIVAQGVFFDLENNNMVQKESRRRITTKEGKRFGADMLMVTANAAASIAYRNAVFAGIPKAIYWPVYEAAVSLVKGDIKTLEGRRVRALGSFQTLGYGVEAVCKALGVDNRAAIGPEQIVVLSGWWNAIKQEEADPETIFTGKKAEPAKATGKAPAAKAVTGKAPAKETAPPKEEPKPEPEAPAEYEPTAFHKEIVESLADCKSEADVQAVEELFAKGMNDLSFANPPEWTAITADIEAARAGFGDSQDDAAADAAEEEALSDEPFAWVLYDTDGAEMKPKGGEQWAAFFERTAANLKPAALKKLIAANEETVAAALKNRGARDYALRVQAAFSEA